MTEQEKKYFENERLRNLRIRLRSFGTAVKNMRRAQRDYFNTPSVSKEMKKTSLRVAVQHEQQVDEYLKLLENEKLL